MAASRAKPARAAIRNVISHNGSFRRQFPAKPLERPGSLESGFLLPAFFAQAKL